MQPAFFMQMQDVGIAHEVIGTGRADDGDLDIPGDQGGLALLQQAGDGQHCRMRRGQAGMADQHGLRGAAQHVKGDQGQGGVGRVGIDQPDRMATVDRRTAGRQQAKVGPSFRVARASLSRYVAGEAG